MIRHEINGWFFNHDEKTRELVGPDMQNGIVPWSKMSVYLLNALMGRLVGSSRWANHVKEIKEELKTRPPPKSVTSVTVEGKLR